MFSLFITESNSSHEISTESSLSQSRRKTSFNRNTRSKSVSFSSGHRSMRNSSLPDSDGGFPGEQPLIAYEDDEVVLDSAMFEDNLLLVEDSGVEKAATHDATLVFPVVCAVVSSALGCCLGSVVCFFAVSPITRSVVCAFVLHAGTVALTALILSATFATLSSLSSKEVMSCSMGGLSKS